MKTETRIVIIGGGYAGLMAALRLSGKTRKLKTDITLVNGRDTFVERPRLHQVATGQDVAVIPMHDFLRGTRVHFRQGWATAIDLDGRLVTVQDQHGQESVPYDILVYALGSVVDQESVPGVQENAFVFDADGPNGASALHEKLQELTGRVVVVGGGRDRHRRSGRNQRSLSPPGCFPGDERPFWGF